MRLCTLGYQGLNLTQYCAILHNAQVGLVIDVRENPLSVKAGFSKTELRAGLKLANIAYEHLRSVGNPFYPPINASSNSANIVLDHYRGYLLQHPSALPQLWTLINEANTRGLLSCLTCRELAPQECHRSVLVEELQRRYPQIEAWHLPL
jgi:uncharacterized protein (DUF488 family)